MMKKIISRLLLATLMGLIVNGCSDNTDPNLEPIEMTRTLALSVESENYSNGKLTVGAISSSTEVSVQSNTRWSVEVTDCEGSWCEVSPATGAADGTFSINVRENLSGVRNCYVRVYKTDKAGEKEISGSQEILVTQNMNSVRLSPTSIEPFQAKSPRTASFDITANVAWTLNVTYEGGNTAEFVTITTGSGSFEPDGTGYKGTGNASFTISLQDNLTAAERTAYLHLNSDLSDYSVEIRQLKPDFVFDVSPTEAQTIPAAGGQIEFGILSLSDWTVTTSADWISFSTTGGQGGNSRVITTATIQPANSRYERTAEIRFNPTQQNYQGQTVTVTQRGFDMTFTVSPSGTLGEVPNEGEVKRISIDSRFDWELLLPEWISADKVSGTASMAEQPVSLTVNRNTIRETRTGTVTIVPKVTEFAPGAFLDPTALGIEPLRLTITQLGGDRPANSDNPTPTR